MNVLYRSCLERSEIDKAVEILNNAERPVIYAGFGGVKAPKWLLNCHVKIKHQSLQLVKTLGPSRMELQLTGS